MFMSNTSYDVVVIGAGSAGLTSAVGFSKVGRKVLLVENEHMGGECTNTGCIPSKALLHHAKNYHKALQIADGDAKSESFRLEAFTYVRNVINSILEEETPETFKNIGIDVVMGDAEFVSKSSIKVDETEYHYKKAIIATGSSPRNLSVPGLEVNDVLTNQNLFELASAPKKLLVIGSGPIGLEMSQALAMLGSHVTIATIDKEFAKLEDPAIRPILRSSFEDLGIKIHQQAFINKVEGKEAVFDIKDGEKIVDEVRVSFDKILVAIGRVPNIPSGLETAGIEFDNHSVIVDSQHRTSNKNVFAVGDVAQKLKFTHTADDVARQVVTYVVSKGLIRLNNKKAVPKVTYTVPEIAQVGMSWSEAIEKHTEEKVMRIEIPFSKNDRAKTDESTNGVLVVVARRLSGKVLGAHIIGPSAGELITIFTLAIDQKISLWKLRKIIFAYPTYSLIIKKAADQFFGQQVADLKTDLKFIVKKNLFRVLAGLLWTLGIYAFYHFQSTQNLSASDTALLVFDFIAKTFWGPLLYIFAYTVRPLTFFPGTLLTILSGVFFGLFNGIVLTIIAANISAALAYGVGRFFGNNLKLENSAIESWVNALRLNPFLSILTTRLIFLPFDIVSYVAGILRISFSSFIFATIIGTILGIATFVAIGASISIEDFKQSGFSTDVIDVRFILLSVIIFLSSIGIAKIMKRTS
jgi:pyruvate/2-oxoglutarate dehydrogenase complex dihydrolipoamide dehydrogenase (E3) component/uncharacterized membrane protein YdjX (TVP38/TMEM64 family)